MRTGYAAFRTVFRYKRFKPSTVLKDGLTPRCPYLIARTSDTEQPAPSAICFAVNPAPSREAMMFLMSMPNTLSQSCLIGKHQRDALTDYDCVSYFPGDDMSISDRLKARREALRLTQSALAKKAGVSQSTIGNIEAGTRSSPSSIPQIAAALGVRAIWLADGKGEMLDEQGNSGTKPRPIRGWQNEDELEDGDVLVPSLELNLSAGPGETLWQIDTKGRGRVFQVDFLDRLGIKPECAATMTVKGSSMEPRLWDGDSLLVDFCRKTILDGHVYALVWQGEYYIKRLFKEPGGSIRMVSDNSDKSRYQDRLIKSEHMDEMQIIGEVVGIVGGRL